MSDEFRNSLPQLLTDLEEQMLSLVWRGYDRLCHVYTLAMSLPDDRQIERDITSSLASYMTIEGNPNASFHVQHEAPEMATAASDGGHPPAYDIAFVLNANLRVRWPLESKILRDERKVSAYVDEVRDNFLTGRYAPFLATGGMLGLLLSGDPEAAARSIAESLGVALDPFPPHYPTRSHFLSHHVRNPGYPDVVAGAFACHHLIMPITAKPDDT